MTRCATCREAPVWGEGAACQACLYAQSGGLGQVVACGLVILFVVVLGLLALGVLL